LIIAVAAINKSGISIWFLFFFNSASILAARKEIPVLTGSIVKS
jgi:hypothetical protein